MVGTLFDSDHQEDYSGGGGGGGEVSRLHILKCLLPRALGIRSGGSIRVPLIVGGFHYCSMLRCTSKRNLQCVLIGEAVRNAWQGGLFLGCVTQIPPRKVISGIVKSTALEGPNFLIDTRKIVESDQKTLFKLSELML